MTHPSVFSRERAITAASCFAPVSVTRLPSRLRQQTPLALREIVLLFKRQHMNHDTDQVLMHCSNTVTVQLLTTEL